MSYQLTGIDSNMHQCSRAAFVQHKRRAAVQDPLFAAKAPHKKIYDLESIISASLQPSNGFNTQLHQQGSVARYCRSVRRHSAWLSMTPITNLPTHPTIIALYR